MSFESVDRRVEQIIARMERGEPLRWIRKSVSGRLADGYRDDCELFIGSTLIWDNETAAVLIDDPRVQELPKDESGTTHYELIEASSPQTDAN